MKNEKETPQLISNKFSENTYRSVSSKFTDGNRCAARSLTLAAEPAPRAARKGGERTPGGARSAPQSAARRRRGLAALRQLTAENEEVLFASRSLGGPLTLFHCLSLLADYHFLYSMGHVRGNFDLKTMAARVGSGPSVMASHP